jgi:phage gp29-like protein
MASWLRRAVQTLWPIGDDSDEKPTLRGLDLKFHQWEPMLPPTIWTWGAITSTNTTHEAGLFQQSARLCDSLFRDDKIAGLVQTRLLELRDLRFWFEDPDGTVSEDEQLYKDWLQMFPKSVQLEAAFWTLFEGFCIGQLRWDMDTLVPRLQIWHPGNCYWDKQWLHWMVYTREGGTVRLIGENAPGNGKWVIFKTWIDERPWMAGIIRAIGFLLLIRQTLLPDFLRYAKKFGAPSTWLKMPAMMSEIKDAQDTVNALATMNNGSVIHLFNDMDIGLIEPKSNSWETFIKFLEYIDSALELLILGSSDVSTSGRNGTKASAIVKDKPRLGRLRNDIDILATTAHEQIVHPYFVWNRGIEDLEDTPTPVWDPTPPENAQLEAEAQKERAIGDKNAAEALEKLVELVPSLDREEYARSYKWPLKEGGKSGRRAAAASLSRSHLALLKRVKPEHGVPGLKQLLAAVKASKDPADMKRRVLETYQKMDPDRLARELAGAKVRAEKAGLEVVLEKLDT